MIDHDERLIDLIESHICRRLTPEQNLELQTWINICNHNRNLFQQLTDPQGIIFDLQAMDKINGQDVWAMIREKVPGLPIDFK
jgi:hypothetical protein